MKLGIPESRLEMWRTPAEATWGFLLMFKEEKSNTLIWMFKLQGLKWGAFNKKKVEEKQFYESYENFEDQELLWQFLEWELPKRLSVAFSGNTNA